MRIIIGAVARYLTSRPLLAAFIIVGTADVTRGATLVLIGLGG